MKVDENVMYISFLFFKDGKTYILTVAGGEQGICKCLLKMKVL